MSGDAADGDLYQVTVTASTQTNIIQEVEGDESALLGNSHSRLLLGDDPVI